MKKRTLKKVISVATVCVLASALLAGCNSSSEKSEEKEETASSETSTSTSDTGTSTSDTGTSTSDTGSSSSDDVLVLKLGHGNPASGMTGQGYDKFAEYVDELSNGTMEIDVYPSGSLVDDSDSFDSVMAGTVDMIHDNVQRESGTIPDLSVLEIPGYFSGTSEEWLSFAEDLREPLTEIYEEYNIKYLAGNYQGTSVFVSNGKQILMPSDLNGMSVRAMGTWISKAIEDWGGAPTTLSLSELPNALERGTVDAAFTGWVIAVPNDLYEMSDYVTYTQMTECHAMLLMNLDVWNSLTEDQQDVLEEAAREFEEFTVQLTEDNYQDGLDQAAELGCEAYVLSDEENQAFLDLSDPLFDECASSLTEKGEELLDIVNKYK